MNNQIHNQNQIVTNENNENQNESFIFEPVAPHPEPVDIGELLAEIETTIKRHVVLNDAAATALAVWVVHTYVYEIRDTVAYVAIESPEKRCGKTTLLTVLAAMANKPLIASNVTVGALFRAIDTCGPTDLLQDIYAMLVLMKETKMFTRTILTFLKDPEFAPTSVATKYSGLDEIKIAQSLRPYGIKPIALRIGKAVGKGYHIDELSDAVARYVPKAEIDARIQDLDLEENTWNDGEEEMVRSDKA